MVAINNTNVASGAPQQHTNVRVVPANEAMRKALKHPSTGMPFGESMSDSVEWPNDQFTKRRIRDGDVKRVDDQQQGEQPQGDQPQGEQPQGEQAATQGEGEPTSRSSRRRNETP